MNKQIFDAIRMERSVMFFLLMFIILVAAFGIMNTLITVTVQKTREIGVMKALGAQTHQIIGVFLAQGMVVGVFGTATGLLLGISMVQYRNEVSRFLSTPFTSRSSHPRFTSSAKSRRRSCRPMWQSSV